MMAMIRNGYLWTCQYVGLSSTNGSYNGDQTGTNVNRSAVQWINFQVGTTNLSYNTCERIFDTTPTNPFWYYFPSLAVNCNGDMVMGYSGSSATNFISAYYSWRFSGSSTSTRPALICAGNTNYYDYRWGDYSATSLDPTDDWSVWTVQQYACRLPFGLPFATWIAELNRDP